MFLIPIPTATGAHQSGEGRGKGIAGRSDVVECYVVTISKHFNWPIYRFNYVFMRNIESVIRKNTHRATSRSRRGRQQERESERDRERETDLWLIAVRATQQILTILESPVDERATKRARDRQDWRWKTQAKSNMIFWPAPPLSLSPSLYSHQTPVAARVATVAERHTPTEMEMKTETETVDSLLLLHIHFESVHCGAVRFSFGHYVCQA